MIKKYRFMIKGSFYYAAQLAMEQHRLTPNTTLTLKTEPDNAFDPYAVQIWLPSHQANLPGLLIGYVPRQLARVIHSTLAMSEFAQQKTHAAPAYRLMLIAPVRTAPRLQLECQLSFDQAWLRAFKMLLWCFLLRQQNRIQRLHYWIKSFTF